MSTPVALLILFAVIAVFAGATYLLHWLSNEKPKIYRQYFRIAAAILSFTMILDATTALQITNLWFWMVYLLFVIFPVAYGMVPKPRLNPDEDRVSSEQLQDSSS